MRFFSKIKSSKFMIGCNIRQNSASKCTVSVKCICKICGKSKQHEMGCLTNAADFVPFSARPIFSQPTMFTYCMLNLYCFSKQLCQSKDHTFPFFSYFKYIYSLQYVDHFSYKNAENTSMSKVQIYCCIQQQWIFVGFKALLLN